MGTDLKPIETEYAGIKFRSRLEARWAMLFDELNIAWEYEAEAYSGSAWSEDDKFSYLPDFHLPNDGYWCEVKGDPASVPRSYLTMLGFVGHFLPGVRNSDGARGVVLLGGIPRTDGIGGIPGFTVVSHYKGCSLHTASFIPGGLAVVDERSFDFGSFRGSYCDEYSLTELDPNELWRHRYLATNDGAREVALAVRAAYATVRAHRFWNPQ